MEVIGGIFNEIVNKPDLKIFAQRSISDEPRCVGYYAKCFILKYLIQS